MTWKYRYISFKISLEEIFKPKKSLYFMSTLTKNEVRVGGWIINAHDMHMHVLNKKSQVVYFRSAYIFYGCIQILEMKSSICNKLVIIIILEIF